MKRVIRWVIRVRQIIHLNLKMELSLIILDGQSAWLYPSVFPSILTDCERGLSQNQNVFLTFHKHKMPLLIFLGFFTGQKSRFTYPFLHFNRWNPYPFIYYADTWKKVPFRAEPPWMGHYREYPPRREQRADSVYWGRVLFGNTGWDPALFCLL